MDTFDHVLNWKLKIGYHPFPGPNGGTCINEAAVVAAGFEYRPISYPGQMPKCFSRPICRLAMQLNDEASDKLRQRLLPYVTRLACVDTPEIEKQREDYILRHAGEYFRSSFNVGLQILEGALAIGRQADPLGPDEVLARMGAIKAKTHKPAPVLDAPFFSKAKSWLLMKEDEPSV